jgi:flagellar biosynthesis/type III secretory pathway chaperone
VASGRNRVSLRQELLYNAPHVLARAAAKPRQGNGKNGWITHRCIESRGALLDLTHDHVWAL